MVRFILLILAALLLAAHHLRADEPGLLLFWLSTPLLLAIRAPFAPYAVAATQVGGAGIWLHTGWSILVARQAMGFSGTRAGLIIAGAALLSLATAALFIGQAVRQRRAEPGGAIGPPLAAGALTAALLSAVLLKAPVNAILLERFLIGGGWLQVLWVSVYAAWLTGLVLLPREARRWRPRVWLLFSLVFYGQLALGLLGAERFLMTGELHLPVPAIIAAGPVFRGGGFFMAALFAGSILFVGPAWCSWLCYLGGWDNLAARHRPIPGTLPPWRGRVRLALLIAVLGVAFLLGRLGIPGGVAAALGGLFGVMGIGIMATLSRRCGVMVHCTAFCPIGWLATRLGRINPFRIRIEPSCTECLACTRFCRFDALSETHIRARKVGEACTLCGDCVTACLKTGDIHYALFGLRPTRARAVFLVLAVTMHASFLGLAMI